MHKILSLAGMGLAAGLLGTTAATADVVLPTANCGLAASNNCLIFNDFTVYSLALLNYQAGLGTPQPGDPFYVSSTGTAIANALVVASGDANAINNQDVLPGAANNAYNSKSGVVTDTSGTGTGNFLMTAPQSAPFTGSTAAQSQTKVAGNPSLNGTLPLWSVQTSALQTYLNGGALDFFFNLNQENSGTSYLQSSQDALATLEIIFTNSATGKQATYYLNGDSCGGVPGSCVPGVQSSAQTSVNNVLQNSNDLWTYVHGAICVSNAGAVLSFGACDNSNPQDAGGTTVNQNLGANDAAFALYSQAVQSALDSNMYDIMSVDLRMAGEDNGFEQLFIEPGNAIINTVPEPASFALFGAGLGLIGWVFLRRRKAA